MTFLQGSQEISPRFRNVSHLPSNKDFVKGELQRKNKLISCEGAFKILRNDMYITLIGQAVLELLSFKVGSENHQRESPYFRNFRKYEAHFTENDVISDKS